MLSQFQDFFGRMFASFQYTAKNHRNQRKFQILIVDYLADFQKKRKKPLLVGCNGGPYTEKMVKLVEKHNVPVYQDLRTWVEAAGALVQLGKIQGK